MTWLLAVCAGLSAWVTLLWWRLRPRPDPVPAARADPYAGEIAEFRRMLGDWCRG